MKKTVVVTVALAFVLLSAGAALAGIAGSKHDMRTHLTFPAGSEGYNEICVYCHTPHSALSIVPLWNRTNPANGGYVPYTSNTMNAAPTASIGAGSLLCMSCHDGSLAIDSGVYNTPNFNNGTPADNGAVGKEGVNVDRKVAGNALLGLNLSNDHPVGFAYADASADGSLEALLTVQGSTIVKLISGTQVECATCHDAHNTVDMPFLRSSNLGSRMCTVCHLK